MKQTHNESALVLNRLFEVQIEANFNLKKNICIVTASKYSTYFSQGKNEYQSKTPQPPQSDL